MPSPNKGCSRRDFLKLAGTAGVSAMVSQPLLADDASAAMPSGTVPQRPFGKTGKTVSVLSLGGMFDIPSNQIILKLAMKFGVTYWDTAHVYGNGVSETGIGKYFESHPGDREKIFLVSKAYARDPQEMSAQLKTSLQRMQTNHIDLYFMHAVNSTSLLNDDIRKWTDKAKKQGKIKLFGFSTHQNMPTCLMDAAKMDWIDGIMTAYNFRLMHQNDMKEAVQACTEAGIGITAMKTQGGGSVKTSSDTEIRMAGRFVQKGFTNKQAKLKAVWEDSRIASICSQMPNSTILTANIAAALNQTRLGRRDMDLMHQYALETCSGYCSGCTTICEPLLGNAVPIGDLMRYLMYRETYTEKAFTDFLQNRFPRDIHQRISRADFSEAEKRCPQKMKISSLMHQAAQMLA